MSTGGNAVTSKPGSGRMSVNVLLLRLLYITFHQFKLAHLRLPFRLMPALHEPDFLHVFQLTHLHSPAHFLLSAVRPHPILPQYKDPTSFSWQHNTSHHGRTSTLDPSTPHRTSPSFSRRNCGATTLTLRRFPRAQEGQLVTFAALFFLSLLVQHLERGKTTKT
jgi:hypothetical protein